MTTEETSLDKILKALAPRAPYIVATGAHWNEVLPPGRLDPALATHITIPVDYTTFMLMSGAIVVLLRERGLIVDEPAKETK